MKKIIFISFCFFSSVYFASAASLVSEELPYYVKISKNGNEKILKVKKIYDKDTLNVVFNIDYLNYDNSNNFIIHEEYSKKIWKSSNTDLFSSIVYYGYNHDNSDLSYFLTQVVIWQLINSANVVITDEFGRKIDDYYQGWAYIFNTSINHNSKALFFIKEHNVDLWDTYKFTYDSGNLILENPVNDNFEFKNDGKDLYIYAKEVGNYNLKFTKSFEQELYCYEDGVNVYWQSLKGPANVSHTLKYNVLGAKLNIKENLLGINNRFGDAKLNSTYEIYLDNTLKQSTSDFNNIILKSNSNYILKDISNNIGVYNIDDIDVEIKDKEYLLEINKEVISKNISINIETDNNYYIYLKSNNELYEIVNKNTDLITLPYGIYYIKDDNEYYQEIEVLNSIDDVLTIKKNEIKIEIGDEKINEKDQELVKEDTVNKEEDKIINNNEQNLVKEDTEKDEIIENNIDNPMTYDYISDYLFYSFISILIIVLFIKKVANIS